MEIIHNGKNRRSHTTESSTTQRKSIKCHVNDVAELRKRFGREVVYETHGSSLPEVARRVTDQSSYEHVLGEFLKSKGWEKTHSAEAMKYLKKVKGKMK